MTKPLVPFPAHVHAAAAQAREKREAAEDEWRRALRDDTDSGDRRRARAAKRLDAATAEAERTFDRFQRERTRRLFDSP